MNKNLTITNSQIPICPKENKNAIIDHIGYALYAFGGLGMEILLLLLEATIYGTSYTSWTSSQTVLHQLITCLFWGSIGYFLAKKLPYREKYSLSPIRRLFLLLLITGSIVITSIMWGGFKPAAEFAAMSPFTFLIQYLYYSAEAFLLFLIIAHGQQGFALVFKKHTLFPFGGNPAGYYMGSGPYFYTKFLHRNLCLCTGTALWMCLYCS